MTTNVTVEVDQYEVVISNVTVEVDQYEVVISNVTVEVDQYDNFVLSALTVLVFRGLHTWMGQSGLIVSATELQI